MNAPSLDISRDVGTSTGQPGSELAREMRRCWRAGERAAAEDFLARRPAHLQSDEAAVDLIYEEFCLRLTAGENGVDADILRRFPQWAQPLRVMFDCHRRLLQADHDQPQFPEVGDHIGDFRLLAELACGSRGRVFLANETSLCDRAMVLKITPLDEGREHLSLARLQHTNIVPLYSVFDDRGRRLRVLCMPYFGRATLGALLEALKGVPVAARKGADVVRAMGSMEENTGGPRAAMGGAARQMLEQVSYERAMCWITACLADALQFAHERGVVHLDLKPSNVLLATDGQPMLLDYHLAREPIQPGGAVPEHFGGTPPYMPPEQLAAMMALQNGSPVDAAVDARADIYSLGAILYESLGGERVPVSGAVPGLERIGPRRSGSQVAATPASPLAVSVACARQRRRRGYNGVQTALATVNPGVSAGLSEIIAKCLARRPEDRYRSAAALAEDLRRHLIDQPLVGVPNRNVAERWHKWRRRRPGALRAGGMFVLVTGMLALLVLGTRSMLRDRELQAELALDDGDRRLQAGNFTEAITTFERGLALVEPLPFERSIAQHLREQLAVARRLRIAAQLHALADEVRVLYGVESIPPQRLRLLTEQCDEFWGKRDAILDWLQGAHEPQISADLQDIAIFAASLHAGFSPGSSAAALRILDEAEATFGPSAALDHQRQSHRLAAGLSELSPVPAMPRVARTAPEYCALGRAYLAAGNLGRAAQALSAARQLDPAGRWPNFYYGVCAYRMGRHEDAVAAFSVCIGTAPELAACFYNRGLAYAALGRTDQALIDYDRALQLDPSHAQARKSREMIRSISFANQQPASERRPMMP